MSDILQQILKSGDQSGLDKMAVIIWADYGYEGWKPTGYATDADAAQAIIRGEFYGARYLVTRLTPVEIKIAP